MYDIKNLLFVRSLPFSYGLLVIIVGIIIISFLFFRALSFKIKSEKDYEKKIQTKKVLLNNIVLSKRSFKSFDAIKRPQIKTLRHEVRLLHEKDLLTGKINNRLLMQLLDKNLSDSKNWENFRHEFKKTYPIFYSTLIHDFPELTESNNRLLFLKKMDFHNDEIAELLNLTPAAVVKSLQRMKVKLGDRYMELMNLARPD